MATVALLQLGHAGPGAIKVTLEAMSEDAKGTAIFEVLSPEDKQDLRIPEGFDVHWIVNADPHEIGVQVIKMVRQMDVSSGSMQTCIAGESGRIKTLRQDLLVERELGKEDCYISGY